MSEVSLDESQTWRVELLFQFLCLFIWYKFKVFFEKIFVWCVTQDLEWHIFFLERLKHSKCHFFDWFEWLLDKIWTHHSSHLPYLSLYDIISIFIQFLTLLCHWWCGSLNLSTIFNLHSRYWVDRMPVFTFKVSGVSLVYQAGPSLPIVVTFLTVFSWFLKVSTVDLLLPGSLVWLCVQMEQNKPLPSCYIWCFL